MYTCHLSCLESVNSDYSALDPVAKYINIKTNYLHKFLKIWNIFSSISEFVAHGKLFPGILLALLL